MLIYNGLDLQFQQDLAMPLLSTPLEGFLQELDNHKDIWWGLAALAARPTGKTFSNPYYAAAAPLNWGSYYNNSTRSYEGQSRFNNHAGQPNARESFYQTPFRGNLFQQPRDRTDLEQANAKQIEPPKPKLMITAGPANGSDLRSKQDTCSPVSPGRNNPFYPGGDTRAPRR